MRIALSLSLPVLLSFLLITGCGQSSRHASEISGLGEFVSAFVPEIISSGDAARVRFARPVVADSLVGSAVSTKAYSLSPSIRGAATWEDASTFSFRPAAGFPPGGQYALILHLDRIVPDIGPEMTPVRFDFAIRPIELYITATAPAPSAEDASAYAFTGTVVSSEPLDAAAIEQAVSIRREIGSRGQVVRASWSAATDGRTHAFVVRDINRSTNDEQLVVRWDGAKINSPSKGSLSYSIPAAGTFKVANVSLTPGAAREITIAFSDHLDTRQDLTGLISLNNMDGGFDIIRKQHLLSILPDVALPNEITVRLDGAIRRPDGKTLDKAESIDVSFEDLPPQVALVGSGNIVPNSGEVIFPFKAVNLRAVDVELFQVFENNVLQFLQSYDLNHSYGYRAVGRVVGLHRVALDNGTPFVKNTWQRYAIDISHYTELQPGAIYEVRIGFKPSYTDFTCSDADINDDEVTNAHTDNGEQSIWRYYYNYDDFSYNNRRNPCKKEYYTAENFVRKNLLASNLGLSARGDNKEVLHVDVRDLRSTKPVQNCAIAAYDFQQQFVGRCVTDREGHCSLSAGRQIAFLIAEKDREKGYLKLLDGNALSVSDFDVAGVSSEHGMKGFIYADRDIWRPGDTIFLNFVLQTGTQSTSGHPVTCVVFNPRGQKRFESTNSIPVGPVYSFPVPTDISDITGNWHAEIRVGGVQYNKTLKVETIKPNRLKIAIDTDGPVEAWKDRTTIPLAVQWLHGAPASGLAARVELALRPVTTSFAGYSRYTFDDPARQTEPSVSLIYDGALDANGHAQITIPHDRAGMLPGRMSAAFRTRVFESGGDFSTDQFTAEWQPYQAYTGIAVPVDRWGSKRLGENADHAIALVSVDNAGKPLANRRLHAGIYHAEWYWWWNESSWELAQFNTAQHLEAFRRDTLITGADGTAQLTFRPAGYGMYLIRVCDEVSGHCSGELAYAGHFRGEGDARNAAARLTLSTDKINYRTGDEVQLSIPSSPGSTIEIHLVNQQKVLKTERLQTQDNTTIYRFRATDDMAPNIYAYVRLIQPHNHGENDLPLRMYGIMPILVEDPATRLHPVITMPDVIAPEERFKVTVSEKSGRPMAYTVAIVDEGLLDLTRFRTPNPWDHFFAKEALLMKSWDLYDQVLGAYGGPIERVLAIGGDGVAVDPRALNEVNRFKPVVMHLGPFYLKAGAKAVHELQMPNYVGSVRAMVVASDPGRYGAAEKTVPVKSPLMVLATLPRVLAPGEQIAIPVNVFVMDPKIRNVEVRIRGNDQIYIQGQAQRQVTFSREGDQLVTFTAEVSQVTGTAEVWIEAVSGNEKASQHIVLAVRNPNPYVSEVTEVALAKGESWQVIVEDLGVPGTNEHVLEVSSLFPPNLSDRLRYLIRYPYGCLEQTVSSAFPQLYVDRLMDADHSMQAEIKSNVRAAIAKTGRHLAPNQGFAYWPGGSYYNEWSQSYAGHFLVEAQRAGYTVDHDLLDAWKTLQTRLAQQYQPVQDQGHGDLVQSYRLYTLAQAGAPDLGAMNRLRGQRALTSTARYLLAASYAVSGQQQAATDLLANVSDDVDNYVEAGYTFGSALRDRALIVEALIACGRQDQALPIIRRIAEEIGSSRWYSTQSTAFALIALSQYAQGGDGQAIEFALTANDRDRRVVRQQKAVFREFVAIDGKREVSVENLTDGIVHIRLTRSGRPLNPSTTTTNRNLQMEFVYQTLDGKTLDPTRIPQGTDFMLSVTVRNPGTFAGNLRELALQTIYPSGWEIINQRLDNIGMAAGSDASIYQDIRDDRVYTFFDLHGRSSKTYRFALNAAYEGRFILPSMYCEAMYDNAVQATSPGQWVEVVKSTGPLTTTAVTGSE